LRRSGAATGPGFLNAVYGAPAGILATLFSSAGILLNLVGQILASVALLTSLFNISPFTAAIIAVTVIIIYVVFGGVWSTGLVGSFKVLLLYLAMAGVGLLAFRLGGGASGLTTTFEPFPWFSLFGRGLGPDLAAAFSMIVGVISTQTYLQAIFSGRNVRTSQRGAIISAIIIPPIGLAGILVGLYMRATQPGIVPRQALPLFILEFLPDWFGGIALATLFIATVGTGAGLVLGVSTMFTEDIYRAVIAPQAGEKKRLWVSRLAVVAFTLLGLFFVSGNLNSLILEWSFLSMGLRGATIFFPLLGAIFLRGHVSHLAGVLAIGLAPATTILWAIFGTPAIDPLYVGLLVSIGLLGVVSIGARSYNQGK
jgi:SSS family solute:Na+ symporter